MSNTHPAALALLEEKRLALRKIYFGKAGPAPEPDESPLARAIQLTFPNSDASYWRLIHRRYTEAYGVPDDEAIKAVTKGYSSPSAAMNARVIKRRPYLGFEGQR